MGSRCFQKISAWPAIQAHNPCKNETLNCGSGNVCLLVFAPYSSGSRVAQASSGSCFYWFALLTLTKPVYSGFLLWLVISFLCLFSYSDRKLVYLEHFFLDGSYQFPFLSRIRWLEALSENELAAGMFLFLQHNKL